MRTLAPWICVCAAALLALSGCHRQEAHANAQAASLERVFPGLATADAPPEPSPPEGSPKAYVRAAIQAERQDDLATAAILLKRAVRSPGMTPAQLEAVQKTRSVWVQELMARAERGDERAKAGLATLNNAP